MVRDIHDSPGKQPQCLPWATSNREVEERGQVLQASDLCEARHPIERGTLRSSPQGQCCPKYQNIQNNDTNTSDQELTKELGNEGMKKLKSPEPYRTLLVMFISGDVWREVAHIFVSDMSCAGPPRFRNCSQYSRVQPVVLSTVVSKERSQIADQRN